MPLNPGIEDETVIPVCPSLARILMYTSSPVLLLSWANVVSPSLTFSVETLLPCAKNKLLFDGFKYRLDSTESGAYNAFIWIELGDNCKNEVSPVILAL